MGYTEQPDDTSISNPRNFVQKVSIKHNKKENTYQIWAGLFEDAEKVTLQNKLMDEHKIVQEAVH